MFSFPDPSSIAFGQENENPSRQDFGDRETYPPPQWSNYNSVAINESAESFELPFASASSRKESNAAQADTALREGSDCENSVQLQALEQLHTRATDSRKAGCNESTASDNIQTTKLVSEAAGGDQNEGTLEFWASNCASSGVILAMHDSENNTVGVPPHNVRSSNSLFNDQCEDVLLLSTSDQLYPGTTPARFLLGSDDDDVLQPAERLFPSLHGQMGVGLEILAPNETDCGMSLAPRYD
ncbi:hypothetical protein L218DRAFT_231380 [Marasmius fiardii PR-910]|nr:hypothetical protein L218DRAFT_231380 [Marasmius fiardii PR-910]